VLNPKTVLNQGFDSYKLMDQHNDMRAMVRQLKFSADRPSFYLLNVGETHYPYALPDEPEDQWPRISGVHGVFKHLDDLVVGGKLRKSKEKFFDDAKMEELRKRQVRAVGYLDKVVEELFDVVPKNTYITITADHGELFGEDGYFGHGPPSRKSVGGAVCGRQDSIRVGQTIVLCRLPALPEGGRPRSAMVCPTKVNSIGAGRVRVAGWRRVVDRDPTAGQSCNASRGNQPESSGNGLSLIRTTEARWQDLARRGAHQRHGQHVEPGLERGG
jgi:hypothetical protein